MLLLSTLSLPPIISTDDSNITGHSYTILFLELNSLVFFVANLQWFQGTRYINFVMKRHITKLAALILGMIDMSTYQNWMLHKV
jgi:hypothetical protein